MARYYFDVRDGHGMFRDQEGSEHPNDEAARDEATEALAGMIKDALPGSLSREIIMEIRDESRRCLFIACMRYEIARADAPGDPLSET